MLKNRLRHAHKSKDDRKQTKTTGLISKDTKVKRWICIYDIVNRVQLVSAITMGHGYFQSQTECEEVISAVPYISGFIIRIGVFFSNTFKL